MFTSELLSNNKTTSSSPNIPHLETYVLILQTLPKHSFSFCKSSSSSSSFLLCLSIHSSFCCFLFFIILLSFMLSLPFLRRQFFPSNSCLSFSCIAHFSNVFISKVMILIIILCPHIQCNFHPSCKRDHLMLVSSLVFVAMIPLFFVVMSMNTHTVHFPF